MQTYEIRKGMAKGLAGAGLRTIVQECFGTAQVEGDKVNASYGALARLVTWTDGKSLFVDTDMRKELADDVARDTIRAYNHFLERATGYTAKERGKRAQQKAKGGAP